MRIKIISDYRKLMALAIPQDEAIELAATTIIDAEEDKTGSIPGSKQVMVKVPDSGATRWVNEKLGKVRLFTIVCQ